MIATRSLTTLTTISRTAIQIIKSTFKQFKTFYSIFRVYLPHEFTWRRSPSSSCGSATVCGLGWGKTEDSKISPFNVFILFILFKASLKSYYCFSVFFSVIDWNCVCYTSSFTLAWVWKSLMFAGSCQKPWELGSASFPIHGHTLPNGLVSSSEEGATQQDTGLFPPACTSESYWTCLSRVASEWPLPWAYLRWWCVLEEDSTRNAFPSENANVVAPQQQSAVKDALTTHSAIKIRIIQCSTLVDGLPSLRSINLIKI